MGCCICTVVGLIAAVAVAFLTFAAIELPFLQLRQRWLAGRKATRVVAKAAAF
jgi:peptidoglycan/LPS O-acetylase OafA/YrhL